VPIVHAPSVSTDMPRPPIIPPPSYMDIPSPSETDSSSDDDCFQHDVPSALDMFIAHSGAMKLGRIRLLDSDEQILDYIRNEKNAMISSLNFVTAAAKAELETDPGVCAVCGVLLIGRNRTCCLIDDPILDCLCVSVIPAWSTVYERSMGKIPVYKEGIVGDYLSLCIPCKSSLSKNIVPFNSLSGGSDFGKNNLEPLTFAEVMLLSRERLFGCVVQIEPKGGCKVKGTCISFPHPGPDVYLSALQSEPEVPSFLFVGSEDDWIKRKRDILAGRYPTLYRAFQVRPHIVLKWISYLRETHPKYLFLNISEQFVEKFQRAFKDSFESTKCCTDTVLLSVHSQLTTDATNDRFVADDTIHSDTLEHVLLSGDDDSPHGQAMPLQNLCNLVGIPIPVTRSAYPSDEFTHGWEIITSAFPHLFHCGPCRFEGSVTVKQANYLMLFHDGRFARDTRFVFYLREMLLRHRVVRTFKRMSLTGTEKEKSDIVKKFNSQSFKDQLSKCLSTDITNEEARREKEHEVRKILQELRPFLRTASVAGLTSDLSSYTVVQLNSLCTHYGLPTLFVTVSPADFNDMLVMRLNFIADGESSQEIPLLLKADRLRIANDNPVFCAAAFNHLMNVIVRELYGVCSAVERKKTDRPRPGIFGNVRAHYCVTEAQARGTLHFHQLVWMNISPDVLMRCIGTPALVAAISDFLSNIVKNDVEVGALVPIDVPQAQGTRRAFVAPTSYKDSWEARNPIVLPDCQQEFEARVLAVVLESNIHNPLHHSTCAKGNSGKIGCRMGMRRPIVDCSGPVHVDEDISDATVFIISNVLEKPIMHPFVRDERVIIWELSREEHSQYISSYCPALCNVSPHNSSVDFFGAPPQCRPGLYYVSKYVDKPKFALSSSLIALSEASESVKRFPSRASDVGTARRDWCHLLQRWLNNTNRRIEVSAQQAASFLLQYNITMSSDTFWFCFPMGALKFLESIYPEEVNSCPVYTGSLHRRVGDPILVNEMMDTEIDEEIDHDITTDTLSINKESKVVSVAQHLHYFYSPPSIRHNVSYYEFGGIFDVVKHSSKSELVVREAGRHANARFNFDAFHPLFTSHVLKLRSKQCVPNISGKITLYPGPEPDDPTRRIVWNKRLNVWARFCVVTFLPWDGMLRERLADPVSAIDKLAKLILCGQGSDRDVARYQFIYNCTIATQSSHYERSLCSRYRMRSIDKWCDYGIHAPCASYRGREPDSQIDKALDFIRSLADGSLKTKTSQAVLNLLTTLPQLFPFITRSVVSIDCSTLSVTELKELADRATEKVSTLSTRTGSVKFHVHPLNGGQKRVYSLLTDWILGVTSQPPLICLLGGPGTGKSEVAKTLLNDFGPVIISTAWQGISASILGGSTLCSAFFIKVFGKKGEPRLRPMTDVELHFAQEQWKCISLLIIDEISQVTCDVLLLVSERLKIIRQSSKPFGGLGVLLIGDFFQLPPCFGTPLYESDIPLVKNFSTHYLVEQVRSRCPDHTKNLQSCRSTVTEHPFSDVDWSVYGYLTPEDTRGAFADATHICATNEERSILNSVLSREFALRRGKQVLRWRYKLPSWATDAIDADPTIMSHQIYGFFVDGAPGFITQNLSTENLICNGTYCEMVSIGYHSSETATEYRNAVSSGTLIVDVPVPDFIIVRLNNGILFPIQITDTLELSIGRVSVSIKVHGVDIGFACTFHKVQGLTLDYVVLHLTRSQVLKAASVHVGMSRVTAKTKMRVFPVSGGLDHVRHKIWPLTLREYMASVSI